jgi:hypothetical protein
MQFAIYEKAKSEFFKGIFIERVTTRDRMKRRGRDVEAEV